MYEKSVVIFVFLANIFALRRDPPYSMIYMKSLPLFVIMTFIFSSCSTQILPSEESLTSRIINIETTAPNGSSGRGVILRSGEVLTSLHVVNSCIRWQLISWENPYTSEWCFILEHREKRIIQTISLTNRDTDVAYLLYSWSHDAAQKPLILQENPQIWEQVFALVSRSGSWQKREGHIRELNTSYQAYTDHLSGAILSWALVTDIVLERGESGTPLWTASWELIGVVSAVDTTGKKSYIVR